MGTEGETGAARAIDILLHEHRARVGFEALALQYAETIIELRARVAELEATNKSLLSMSEMFETSATGGRP